MNVGVPPVAPRVDPVEPSFHDFGSGDDDDVDAAAGPLENRAVDDELKDYITVHLFSYI